MNSFGVEWLALREAHDARARSATLERRLADGLAARRTVPLEVIDLGGGTGANLRHLAPRLGGAQHWRIVENDAKLIAALPQAMDAWATRAGHDFRAVADGWRVEGARFSAAISLVRCDLARELPALAFGHAGLVTASALLDLVSEAWLDALSRRCADARAPVLFALTYDGTLAWTPAYAGDALVRDAFNAHQRRDKGFGAALGPGAAAMAQHSLAALGYEVEVAASDWSIGSGDGSGTGSDGSIAGGAAAMAHALLSGWVDAAIEARPHAREAISRWRGQRIEAIAGARATAIVGHRDLLGWPPP
jgi:hypothetical protein